MKYILSLVILVFLCNPAIAQEFTSEDLVGTWHGTVTSEQSGSYSGPVTLVVQPDGFYTDSSGVHMPTIYPNTQDSEFDAATNRVHLWYLKTVYTGMRFYQHFFYEVVSFDGVRLEMHYNYWDDPEPHPQVRTIILSKEGVADVEDLAGDLPLRVTLSGNYPNPFNPSTNIEFALPRDEFVTLKVYDLRGQEVSTLVAEHLSAGRYSYAWNASGLADGVYLYRMIAGDFDITRKMTLVK